MPLLRRLLVMLKGGGAKPPINQSNVYGNTIGAIWLIKDGDYENRNSGEGYIWDIPSVQSGYYANRV